MSNKAKPRKSWQEKLADSKGLPKVQEITDKMSKRWGTGTVVIPAPKEVDEIMRKIPEGKLTAVVGIYAVAAPKPAIYEFIFIQDGLKFLGNVFNHFTCLFIPFALSEWQFQIMFACLRGAKHSG